jgi:hypothetical protein
MPDYSVHKASDLAGDERKVIERWLGQSLAGDETICVNAYRPHDAPSDGEREALRNEIVTQAEEIGSRAQDITEEEADDLVREATANVRGRHG